MSSAWQGSVEILFNTKTLAFSTKYVSCYGHNIADRVVFNQKFRKSLIWHS